MSVAERKVDGVDPIDQFRDALTDRGIVPGQIIADGQLHRCDVAGRGGKRDGAYLLHLDSFPAGGFQNFRDGLGWQTWKAAIGRSPTREETKALRARAAAERAQREQELTRRHGEIADKAARICAGSLPCPADHPYLIRKGVQPHGVLISRDAIVVPLFKDGQLRSVQFVYQDGAKRFLAGGEVKGCSYTIEGAPERVIIAEGFATAATLHEATGFTVKVAFDCGNLAPVAGAARSEFPDAQIIVAADDDCRTVGNPGLTKASDAAAGVGGYIAIPDFGESRPEGATDFNDLARHAGIAAVRSCIELALEVGPASTDAGEFGERAHVSFGPYRSGPAGLSYVDPDPEKDPVALSGPIEVLAETRDAAGESWGVLVRWRDHDDRTHEWALPRASLAGDGADARRALMDGGLYVAPGRKAREHLTAYLASVRVGERARAVSRMGWHPTETGLAYVLPDATYGAVNGERVLLQSTSTLAHAFRTAGTLAEWQQHVAAVCVGNSRLVMAVSCAFAAPLLEPMSEESGGINLRGRSRSGKSTALRVAGSVCGGGGVAGFVRQWRATANGLEATAEGHCDALLVLDEMGQVEAREVGEISYMLSNGSGKGRAARDGSGRRPAQWRILFLSSGELSLAEKMMEAGKRAKAGQEVRLADVPADAGVGLGLFEALNGFETADALARHLRDATGRFYGTALRAFLDQFTRRLSVDRDGLVERIAE
ncbi:MAG: DUF927 domain-containing protein, partial [Alphaproteobacteria bacterium]|nr:DUF927 domain-containing protein [Alphaproteobacteria bacterium]